MPSPIQSAPAPADDGGSGRRVVVRRAAAVLGVAAASLAAAAAWALAARGLGERSCGSGAPVWYQLGFPLLLLAALVTAVAGIAVGVTAERRARGWAHAAGLAATTIVGSVVLAVTTAVITLVGSFNPSLSCLS